jgi:hypothetical protein
MQSEGGLRPVSATVAERRWYSVGPMSRFRRKDKWRAAAGLSLQSVAA